MRVYLGSRHLLGADRVAGSPRLASTGLVDMTIKPVSELLEFDMAALKERVLVLEQDIDQMQKFYDDMNKRLDEIDAREEAEGGSQEANVPHRSGSVEEVPERHQFSPL